MMFLSLLMSFCLWMYIQVNTNPVVTTSITVPITYDNSATPDNIDVSYPVDTVEVELVGRQETINELDTEEAEKGVSFDELINAIDNKLGNKNSKDGKGKDSKGGNGKSAFLL